MTTAPQDHQDAKQAVVWVLLVEAASEGRVLTYEHIGKRIGAIPLGVGRFLYPIQDICRDRELPPLTALVVHKGDKLPGSGLADRDGLANAQRAVWAFDWFDVANPYL